MHEIIYGAHKTIIIIFPKKKSFYDLEDHTFPHLHFF